jgi:hypothetical protein
MHGRYTNLQDRDIVEAFAKIYTPFKSGADAHQKKPLSTRNKSMEGWVSGLNHRS